jgi:hypothetical protein
MQQADMAFVANQDTSSPIKKKPLNTLRADELHTIFINKNPEGSPLKVTQDYLSVSSVPNDSYLTPNYPYRITNNDSMEKTMDGAWKRFEIQLKMDEEAKRR